MPRDPKPGDMRRRRNKDAPPVTKLAPLGDDDVVEIPRLPSWEGQGDEVRWWWAMVWSSPMARIYLDADVPALLRLARLIDSHNPSASVLGEIRQLEDRFGLTPLARRRLAWEISQTGGDDGEAAPVEEDDGRWLRAVSD